MRRRTPLLTAGSLRIRGGITAGSLRTRGGITAGSLRIRGGITAAFAVAALLTGAAGCSAASTPSTSTPPSPSAAAAFPATVGKVTMTKRPEKIVSLSATATEMLFAIGAGSQVVAVDDQSNFPANAPKSALSGFKPNAEAIAAKSPDLVVISNDTNKITDQLTALKIPVYLAAAPSTLDQAYVQYTELGVLTGHLAEATAQEQQISADIEKIVKDVPARARPLTYFYELGPDLYSATSKTFVGALLGRLGLTNIADPADKTGSGYPQLSAETIVKANPDFVFLSDTKCCGQSAATVAKRPGWAGVAAVRNHRVVPLDDDIASRWGPRVVDLLRAVAAAVAKVPAS